jgi:hypothetical protein
MRYKHDCIIFRRETLSPSHTAPYRAKELLICSHDGIIQSDNFHACEVMLRCPREPYGYPPPAHPFAAELPLLSKRGMR